MDWNQDRLMINAQSSARNVEPQRTGSAMNSDRPLSGKVDTYLVMCSASAVAVGSGQCVGQKRRPNCLNVITTSDVHTRGLRTQLPGRVKDLFAAVGRLTCFLHAQP